MQVVGNACWCEKLQSVFCIHYVYSPVLLQDGQFTQKYLQNISLKAHL